MAAIVGAPSERTAPEKKSGPGGHMSPGRVNEIQRARMIDAMAEVCSEVGAANSTVSNVIERSGVSRRTFYEIFADRGDCLMAAIEDAYECARSRVEDVYRPTDGWSERMRASLVALLEFFEEEPFKGRLLVSETLGAGPEVLARRHQELARIALIVDEGRTESKAGARPSHLTAESVVGGVISVIQSRMHAAGDRLMDLVGPLMSIITLPYLGAAAAQGELSKPVSREGGSCSVRSKNPLRDTQMRLTYRTVRVLIALASLPGSSNRELGEAAGVSDQGQISKLLTRLARIGLIENRGDGHARGGPNAWTLTDKGYEIRRVIGESAD